MLIGSNTVELNEATMIAIVQYWLDNKLLNKDERSPKVTAVKSGGTSGMTNIFRVDLDNSENDRAREEAVRTARSMMNAA